MNLMIDALGWVGAASLLLAYGLTSAGRLPSQGWRFQALNLIGAVALAVNSGYHGAWPSAALNLVWIAIGLAALLRAGLLGPGRRGRPAPDVAVEPARTPRT